MHPPTLAQAIAEYAALEQRIDALNSAKFAGVCGGCGTVCCRPDVGREAVTGWWVRQVSKHNHGRWWPDDWRTRETCIALGPDGCVLKAGRPVICRSFYCEPFLTACDGVWEVLFYTFLSDLTNFTCHLTRSRNLETMSPDEIRQRQGEILARIREAAGLLDLAERLLDASLPETDRYRIVLKLFCEHPAFLRPMARRALSDWLGDPPGMTD